MSTLNNILIEIEILRKKMTETAGVKGLTDKESIEISQELDRLLNEFEKTKEKESNQK
ncbi:aspartyl-phosphate phosphatase Spo0E family protein [Oceanobacillus bengalensis]|uniref:Aspartyl-phosphate phosphatase Spo0E family protein n=1 Tax=Oceanobacillus bengalensis TaxID=1435466 RepID=A0A494Z1V6_9BACI|nr:aspartyl-phosphate phosphatase Spo0E family protein [Oceanobacillus bengalensis]RKQ16373.1 aspartyl-phosphate phosphatase Spo0E family protein [Oceanobacillus bengalensis]